MPEIVARLAAADFIQSERELWARVVRQAGVKPQ